VKTEADTNGDGKPGVIVEFAGGRDGAGEDRNGDGKPDVSPLRRRQKPARIEETPTATASANSSRFSKPARAVRTERTRTATVGRPRRQPRGDQILHRAGHLRRRDGRGGKSAAACGPERTPTAAAESTPGLASTARANRCARRDTNSDGKPDADAFRRAAAA
jgi:hypothetical protein